MKKLFKTFMAVALIGALATTSSCTKTCDTGYEGTKCDTEVRAKFTGTTATTYTASETGTLSGSAPQFNIIISKSTTDIQKILISNVWNNFTNNTVATVDGDKFTIASQQPDNDGFEVLGTGTISGNIITVNYSVTDHSATPAATDVVTGTWTKQ